MKAVRWAAVIVVAASGAWAAVDSCGAQALESFVGQQLEAVSDALPEGARILPPNSVMTQDHRPDRVNVNLDDKDVITRIWCG